LLKEKDATLRQLAITTLSDSGDKGVAVLVAKLPNADAQDQVTICQGLGRARGISEKTVLTVADLLKSDNPSVVNAATSAMMSFGPRAAPAAAQIAGLLKDPKHAHLVRFRLQSLFTNLGPAGKSAVPTLIEVVKDEKNDDWARQQALLSLGQIGPGARDALPALLDALKSGKVQERSTVLNALYEIDPLNEALAPALMGLLKTPETRASALRAGAITLLGNGVGDPKLVVPALLEAIKDNPQGFQKREIAIALGRIRPAAREAIPPLKELLKTIEPAYAVDVASTLTILGCTDREVLQALVSQATSAQLHFRTIAANALLRLGPAASGCADELLKAWRTEANLNERLRLAEVIAVLEPEKWSVGSNCKWPILTTASALRLRSGVSIRKAPRVSLTFSACSKAKHRMIVSMVLRAWHRSARRRARPLLTWRDS
jgi:HEAT repeat protein